ncbi:MAG: hypothetical protein QME75_12430 [Deltaproteobacteria bacterium]|nr:hypothetical protein [Deltaproteobacteria bacterium]
MAKDIQSEVDKSWRRTVTFTFGGEGGLKTPEGFTDLSVGDQAAILVSGKVTGLSADQNGQGLTLEMDQAELAGTPKRRTIGEMLRELKGGA